MSIAAEIQDYEHLGLYVDIRWIDDGELRGGLILPLSDTRDLYTQLTHILEDAERHLAEHPEYAKEGE